MWMQQSKRLRTLVIKSYFIVLQDNVIFERLTESSQYKELTVAHLEQFATEGKGAGEKGSVCVWGGHIAVLSHWICVHSFHSVRRLLSQWKKNCSLPLKNNNLFLPPRSLWLIVLFFSPPLRPEDSVFCLCRPEGGGLPGVAEGVQSCQHCAQRPRSEARGVLRTAGEGKYTLTVWFVG